MEVEIIDHFGNDLMVVNAARVSYGKSKINFDEKDEKLIKYLVAHKHIAPFRHPQLQFRITCPIFVERQLFKHQVGMCLSGDAEVSFINSSKGISKEKIEDLFNRWTFGRPHQMSKKDAAYSKKRIKNKKLRVLNEDTGIFEIGKIKNIFFSGIKEVYEITLENGKKIKCSEDHRILTKKGWKTIRKNLKVGEEVLCNGIKFVGNGMYRDRDYMKSLREEGLSVQEMANKCGCGYDNIRKWLKIHNLVFSKSETCFQNGNEPWNKGKSGYKLNFTEEGYKKKLEVCRKNVKKGKESHFWRGGITDERSSIGAWTRANAKHVHKKYNYTCQKCGKSSGKLHAHHIIPVAQDINKAKDFDNLITVCKKCHKEIHSSLESESKFANIVLADNFKPFEYTKRIGNRKKFTSAAYCSKVVSIIHVGKEKTYDIEVDHKFHNFVANGIVVHNSANSLSGRYVDFSDSYWLPDELRLQSSSSKQGSGDNLPKEQSDSYIEEMKKIVDQSKKLYKEMSEYGVAKEMCRMILPLCLETQFIWTGSLLAFTHLWNLRLKNDTQKETRQVAEKMLDLVKNIDGNPFKHTLAAFNL